MRKIFRLLPVLFLMLFGLLGCSTEDTGGGGGAVESNHTVNFYVYGDIVRTTEVTHGGVVGSNMPVKPNPLTADIQFVGWNTNPNAAVEQFRNDTPVYSNTNVYAIFESVNAIVTVTFTDGDDIIITSRQIAAGSSLGAQMPPAPVKNGYTFSGWSDDFNANVIVTSNLTVSAVWVKETQTHTVRFISQGSLWREAQVPSGTTVTAFMPDNPTRFGFEFVRWELWGANGNVINFPSTYVVDADVTVYAAWREADVRTVMFLLNNDTNDTQEVRVQYNTAVGVSRMPAVPTKFNRAFDRWVFDDTGEEFTAATVVTDDIVVRAEWKADAVQTFTVIFNADGKLVLVYVPQGAAVGAAWPSDPTKERHRFMGWNTIPNSDRGNFTNQSIVADNIVVYATWSSTARVFTVRFMDRDLSVYLVRDNVVGGAPVGVLPIIADKSDATFHGWATTSGAFQSNVDAGFIVNDNTDLFSVWRTIYNVTFNANGGKFDDIRFSGQAGYPDIVVVEGISHGGAVGDNMPDNPTIDDGRFFNGWGENASDISSNGFNASTPITANREVFAIWRESSVCTISFTNTLNPISSITANCPAFIDLPQIVVPPASHTPPEDYVFLGWSDGVNIMKPEDGKYEATRTITLSAVWAELHTVSFFSDGVLIETIKIQDGESVGGKMPDDPTKTGFTFEGWFEDEDDPDTEFDASTLVDRDINVHAKWDNEILALVARVETTGGDVAPFFEGDVLEVVISPGDYTNPEYEWFEVDNDIPVSTNATFTLTSADVGKTYRVKVSVTGYYHDWTSPDIVVNNLTPIGATFSYGGDPVSSSAIISAGDLPLVVSATDVTITGYSWVPPTGSIAAPLDQDSLIPDITGEYEVTVTSDTRGYQPTEDISITLTPIALAGGVKINDDDSKTVILLAGTTKVDIKIEYLGSESGIEISWNGDPATPNENPRTIQDVEADTYKVVIGAGPKYDTITFDVVVEPFGMEDLTGTLTVNSVPVTLPVYPTTHTDHTAKINSGDDVVVVFTPTNMPTPTIQYTPADVITTPANGSTHPVTISTMEPEYRGITLTITVEITHWNVTLDANGGDFGGGEFTKTFWVADGDPLSTISLPTPPTRTGYRFDGWDFSPTALVTADVTFDAIWVPQVTITFEYQDGATTDTKFTIDEGLAVEDDIAFLTLPTPPARTGYAFIEWNRQADGAGLEFTKADTVSADITVYAIWGAEVTFNDGASQTVVPAGKDGIVTPPADPSEPLNFAFRGWSTSGVAPGVDFTTATFSTPTTLHAIWVEQVTVTFYQNHNIGDTIVLSSPVIDIDTALGAGLLPSHTPRLGYWFVGWNTDRDGIGTNIDGTEIIGSSMVTGSSMNVYAIWEKNKYSITFDPNGGDFSPIGSDPSPMVVEYGDSITAPVVELTGFTLGGWTILPDDDNTKINVTIASGSVFDEDGDGKSMPIPVTLYALWP